ncbi:MAG: LysM peptidoglycan-binding domain-containing protein [Bacteroidales bacterium]|nr:LysM peptidoglycan-binding domain-containing protein [Bacteroidales bacterium]
MHSANNILSKIILPIVLLGLVSMPADAQLKKKQISAMQDSIARLNARVDSLQKAYEELLNAPFEPVEMIGEQDTSVIDWNPDYYSDQIVGWLGGDFDDPQDFILEASEEAYISEIPDSVYIDRLNRINSVVKVPYNDIVRSFIVLYTQKMSKDKIQRMLGLANYYMPTLEEIFAQEDVPVELTRLAVIESSFNVKAVSRARAAGMWQFMYATARQYKLQEDSYVDERFDYEKSAHAAARYMRDAYTIFGDWSLAIASYNCGPGNVNKAIKRSGGGKDFWEVYKYLPRETRGYVPAFVAAQYVLAYYKSHNLLPAKVSIPPQTDTFHISRPLHFGQISEVTGVSMETLSDLNPQYIKEFIPGDGKEYVLRLPYEYCMTFIENEDSIYTYKDSIYCQRVVEKGVGAPTSSYARAAGSGGAQYVVHTVRKGETLGKIAAKYHTTVAKIKKDNGLRSDNLAVGKKLRIYGKGASPSTSTASSASSAASTTQQTASGSYVTHKVKSGETLGGIAQKYGTTVARIKSDNKLSGNTIKVGQSLKIYGKSAGGAQTAQTGTTATQKTTYTVKKGDSLWSIAEKNGLSLSELLRINGFSRNTKVYPGQIVKIK